MNFKEKELKMMPTKSKKLYSMHSMPVQKHEIMQISHSSKFTYQNTYGYKRDRIFDPFSYRHPYNEDELEAFLYEFVSDLYLVLDQSNDLCNNAADNEFLKKYIDATDYCTPRLKHIRFLIEVVNTNLTRYFDFDEENDDVTLYKKMSTLHSTSTDSDSPRNLKSLRALSRLDQSSFEGFGAESDVDKRLDEIGDFYYVLDREKISEFILGEKLVGVPAVALVLQGVNKILRFLKTEFEQLKIKKTREQHKKVFCLMMEVACGFDYFYSAMIANRNSPYYNHKESKYLKDHLEFVNVDDVKSYWTQFDKGIEKVGLILGVASRVLKHESKAKQLLSAAGWMPFYFWFRKEKGTQQGLFFMKALNRGIFRKVQSLPENNVIKYFNKLSLPKVEVEHKLYITMPKDDELTEDNLYSKSTPKMVLEDVDLPFELNVKDYDPVEHIKMRVIGKDDWGCINWKKNGTFIDPDANPIHIPVALFFVHGGGFTGGSSGSYNAVLRRYALGTGYPVFAVDYRLSPKYKFPCHVSDTFNAYLWLRYYSEKYLKMKIDKIIVLGDSAGGCLSFCMTTLCIKRKCIKPDGMVLAYPGFGGDRTNFTPSLLLSIDEPYITASFIDGGLTSFVNNEKVTMKYLCSPIYTPMKLFKQYPPTRIGISGVDPLRDSTLHVFRRLVKSGINVKGKLYKHLYHGYLEMESYPFFLEDCKKAFDDQFVWIEEVVEASK